MTTESVTVLFTDMVGSTALATSLAPDAADEFRRKHDYFGEPVIEAARLCAESESGQILATDVVRAMAGRRNRHECRALGSLTLKGLPDPVATVEVRWERRFVAGPIENGSMKTPTKVLVGVMMTLLGLGRPRSSRSPR